MGERSRKVQENSDFYFKIRDSFLLAVTRERGMSENGRICGDVIFPPIFECSLRAEQGYFREHLPPVPLTA